MSAVTQSMAGPCGVYEDEGAFDAERVRAVQDRLERLLLGRAAAAHKRLHRLLGDYGRPTAFGNRLLKH